MDGNSRKMKSMIYSAAVLLLSALAVDAVPDCVYTDYLAEQVLAPTQAACAQSRNATLCPDPMTCFVGCIGYLHGWTQQPTCQLGNIYDGLNTDKVVNRGEAVIINAGVANYSAAQLIPCQAFCKDVFGMTVQNISEIQRVTDMCSIGCMDAKNLLEDRLEREAYVDPLTTPGVIVGIIAGVLALFALCYIFIKPRILVKQLKEETVQQMAELRYTERKRLEGIAKADRKAERKVIKARKKAAEEEARLQAAREAEQVVREAELAKKKVEDEILRVKQLAIWKAKSQAEATEEKKKEAERRALAAAEELEQKRLQQEAKERELEQQAETQKLEQEAQAFEEAEKARKAKLLAQAKAMVGRA